MKPIFVCAALALSTRFAFDDNAIHPIVDAQSGYLLGGSKNGKWLDADVAAKELKGGESYRVFGLSTSLGQTTGEKPHTNGEPCEQTQWVNLRKNFNGVLALGGSWNAVPRKVRVENLNQNFYKKEVARILHKAGIKKPKVKIAQLWRVDLDGDGEDEVLLSATNYGGEKAAPKYISSSASAGDYSLALLRKIVNGKARTIVLAQQIHVKNETFSAPDEFRFDGVLDANGDGKMEIVLDSRYYEGDATSLIEVKGAEAKEVLSAGCGA